MLVYMMEYSKDETRNAVDRELMINESFLQRMVSFVRSMQRHLQELFYSVPSKIIYCYGEYQKQFDNIELI